MCVEIELVGGAADGRRLALCGDPMDPQAELKVAELRPMRPQDWTQPADPHDEPIFRAVIYIRDREPTRAEEGPMWLYRRQAPAATA